MRASVRRGALVAITLSVPLAAEGGTTVSLQTGHVIPMGDVVRGQPLADAFRGDRPLRLEVGLPVSDQLRLGVYGQYGFLGVQCFEASDCSGRSLRAGLLLTLLDASGPFVPWLAAGAGLEQVRREWRNPYFGSGAQEVLQLTGWELSLQVGVDWALSRRFALGPYVLATVGRYERGSPAASADRSFHGWAHLGMSLRFVL